MGWFDRKPEALAEPDDRELGRHNLRVLAQVQPMTCENCIFPANLGKSFAKCTKSRVQARSDRDSAFIPEGLPEDVRAGLAEGNCPEWEGHPIPEEPPPEFVQCSQCAWADGSSKCLAPQVAADGRAVDRENQNGDCRFHQLTRWTAFLRRFGLRKAVKR